MVEWIEKLLFRATPLPTLREKIIAFFCFLLLWFGLFYSSDILTAGLHFTDDHEIVLFNDFLKTQNAFSLLAEQVKTDFATRFRPLYYPHRVLVTSIIGTNATLWAVYFCLLGVISSFFLFQALRRFGFSIFIAFLFPLFAFWGEQTAVWWRLGTAETFGMLFCSLSMYYLLRLPILGLVFAVLASLSKESFILMLPALLFWKMWYEVRQSLKETQAKTTISNVIKSNLGYVIILGIVGITELYFIQNQTKAEESIFNATAAVDTNFRNTILVYMIGKILTFNKLNILFLTFLALLLFALSEDLKNAKTKVINTLKEISPALLFSLLVLIPQFVLYSRTDLYERYLIPATVGLAFFAVTLIQLIVKQDFIKTYLKIIFCLVGLAGLYFPVGKAYFKGADFAMEGIRTTTFLKFIKTVTPEQSGILLVAEPVQYNEWIQSFYRYANSSGYNLKNVKLQLYSLPDPNVPAEFAEAHKAKVSDFFKNQLFDFEKDKDKIACIAFFPSPATEAKFNQEYKEWIATMDFEKNSFGGFVVYSK